MTVIALMNNKGGVGKTSFTAGIAGVLAATNKRVLVVDLDPQGEQAGWHSLDDGDDGAGIAQALLGGPSIIPVRTGRAGLDVIRGGYHLRTYIDANRSHGEEFNALRPQIDSVRPHYDFILIDSPPGERSIQRAITGTEPLIVVPVDLSRGAMRGLDATAAVVAEARESGYNTQLAGIALINVQPSKRHLAESKLDILNSMVSQVADCMVFPRWIRAAQETVDRMLNDGLLPHEVDSIFETREARRMSSDYKNITKQLLKHIQEVVTHG